MRQSYNTSYDNQYNNRVTATNPGIHITYDHNWTNPIPPPPPPPPPYISTSCGSDHHCLTSAPSPLIRPSPSSSTLPASSSATSSATNTTTTTTITCNAVGFTAPYDYYASEEDFQIQLALAISVSNSESQEDRDKDQKDDSGRGKVDDAESLSRRYWDINILGYDDKVIDGFYDIHAVSMGSSSQGKMPSLADMQKNLSESGFEVVMVNRAIDPALEELDEVAQCLALDSLATDVGLLVQRLAELVTEHMGGSIRDEGILLAMWMEITAQFRLSLHTNVLPIGSLNIGLSRHRALLFKVLADSVGLPCRLVKGSRYTGLDDAAVSIIKLDHEREFLVDLMSAPGTLIPADILSFKNQRLSRILALGSAENSGTDLPGQETLHAKPIDRKGKSIVGASPFVPDKIELEPSSSNASKG